MRGLPGASGRKRRPGRLRAQAQGGAGRPGRADPASAGRRLGAGYSVGIVNPLPLGAADKLPEMRRIAAAERKYLSGTSGIKISDNIQAPSLLGDSEISAVMHAPFKMIPHFNKRGVDGFKRLAPVMR